MILLFLMSILSFGLHAQSINWPELVSKNDLVWNNNLDSSFFHGAFIGDGVQGAMITQDNLNPDGIRMMLGHYKAIAHNYISGVDMCDSRVFIGDIVITPFGNASRQTMRMDIWNGETTGIITTDKGEINWTAISDRKNNAFVVKMKTTGEESLATVSFREQWAVSTAFYGGGKDPNKYVSQVATKPARSTQGDIELITSKMKSRGAQAVATQLVKSDNMQVFYVTIGTDDISDLNKAVQNATLDATTRMKSVIEEDETATITRNRSWWNDYMKSSYLEIKQDPYWQKFWWLQVYKFGCTSSEKAGLLIDTQGPWTTQCGWSAIWWNLNVQLSYYPMYSANKLDVGRSLVDGIDRMHKAGAFRANASSFGGKPGGMVGRSTAYDGKGTWGDEFGNLPWALQCYYKYWKYSGDDQIGKNLFPILKENAAFLISLLSKEADGKYHVKEGRSPEYDDSKLYKDANYTLMSIDWSLKALLELESLFAMNDPLRDTWKEKLDNLMPFPTNANGYMINPTQGFDKGHRHYSHLLAIYPFHSVTIDDNQQTKDVITKSVNRWIDLSTTSGAAGYTFTGGCAMYATLGNGDKALTTLDYLKPKVHFNTMYEEGMNPVIETPLSGVESINYLMLQSWGDVIRIFPALPAKWANARFKDFRTEGAFLVSASSDKGIISDVQIFSEKGKICVLKNPWKDKNFKVTDEIGTRISIEKVGENFQFSTQAGKRYFLTEIKSPVFKSGSVSNPSEGVKIGISEEMKQQNPITGFALKVNEIAAKVDSAKWLASENSFVLYTAASISNSDKITASYQSGNVLSADGQPLTAFNDKLIENLLPGSAPRIIGATTNNDGSQIRITFSKSLLSGSWSKNSIAFYSNGAEIVIDSLVQNKSNTSELILYSSQKTFSNNVLTLSYAENTIKSEDLGILLPFTAIPVQNLSPGEPPKIVSASVTDNGLSVSLVLNKNLLDASNEFPFFSVKINDAYAKIEKASSNLTKLIINLKNPVRYADVVLVDFSGSSIKSTDGGELKEIIGLQATNALKAPVYMAIPGKVEAEKYTISYGIQTEGTSDAGGGQNVGYIDAGDWLDFAVDVAEDGNYTVEYRVAGQGAGKIILQTPGISETKSIATTAFAATGAWQTWTSVKTSVVLKKGKQILRTFFANGQTNFNWISFVKDPNTGIKSMNDTGFEIFPNPASKELKIRSTGFEYNKTEICDINGKVLYSKEAIYEPENKIEINLANGCYLVSLSNSTELRIKKIIVSN
jgi:alpha-L-fucosidase 2